MCLRSVKDMVMREIKEDLGDWTPSWNSLVSLSNHPISNAEMLISTFTDKPAIFPLFCDEFLKDPAISGECYPCAPMFVSASHRIYIPNITNYYSSEDYYHDLWHELGHASRFADLREFVSDFTVLHRSHNELVAEITAIIIDKMVNTFGNNVKPNALQYIQHTIQDAKWKTIPDTIWPCVQKAVNWILGKGPKAANIYDIYGVSYALQQQNDRHRN